MSANALYPPTGRSEAALAQTLADWRFYEDGRDVDRHDALLDQSPDYRALWASDAGEAD